MPKKTKADIPKGSKHRKLKNYLINPRYQLKYVFWLGFGGLTLSVLNGLVAFYYIRENYTVLIDLADMTQEVKDLLYGELRMIAYKLLAFTFGFLIVVTIWGIMVSHRTAGLLYKMKVVFNDIKDGDTKLRLHPRKNDEFKDVAVSFNEMMDQIVGPKGK
ncbi:MAG: methyl-accepting chemotaxis protein [Bacteriovoracaceae bacterium]|nr:methyl-accepting chemotaxis protein [Bacteriovoracaceae bacterium]